MLRPRIIPCLLVKNGGLVKTVNFANPKYVGDPINAVKIFTEKEIDELIVMGVEKVSLSSAAVSNPEIIVAAAKVVGSQSIVVVMDVKKTGQ